MALGSDSMRSRGLVDCLRGLRRGETDEREDGGACGQNSSHGSGPRKRHTRDRRAKYREAKSMTAS